VHYAAADNIIGPLLDIVICRPDVHIRSGNTLVLGVITFEYISRVRVCSCTFLRAIPLDPSLVLSSRDNKHDSIGRLDKLAKSGYVVTYARLNSSRTNSNPFMADDVSHESKS